MKKNKNKIKILIIKLIKTLKLTHKYLKLISKLEFTKKKKTI